MGLRMGVGELLAAGHQCRTGTVSERLRSSLDPVQESEAMASVSSAEVGAEKTAPLMK